MSAIHINNVSFHYEDPYVPVLKGLTVVIDSSWRTVLVGRNGRGKTTLLRLLTGELSPQRGSIESSLPFRRFPAVVNEPGLPTRDVIRACVGPFDAWEREMEAIQGRTDERSIQRYGQLLDQYQRLGGWDINARIEKELDAMSMRADLLDRPYESLSGGEQTRALIVSLFLGDGTFPLIDEPTNHLDIAGREQLGCYLAGKNGFILVSHDRWFLDLCADHVVSINRSDVRVNQGAFSEWRDQMARELEHERRTEERLRREVRSLSRAARRRRTWSGSKEREKIGTHPFDRGRIGHLAAKQMKRAITIERRIEDKLEQKKALLKNAEKERHLKLRLREDGPERLLTVNGLTVRMGERDLFSDLSFNLLRSDRIALIGPNGCGKTSLLRALVGELVPKGGSVRWSPHVTRIRAHQTPLWREGELREHLRSAGIDEPLFRSIMAAFGVCGDIFDRPLETFSHGERKKVDLCRSFAGPTHVLLWDEPLNYIDLMSREQIEEVVLEFEPTMIFIEHDRVFVETVATEVIDLGEWV